MSYGIFQITAGRGGGEGYSLYEFLNWLKSKDSEIHGMLNRYRSSAKSPSGQFRREWERVGKAYPDRFDNLQIRFMKETKFNKVVSDVQALTGINIYERSWGMQAIALSTTTQFGPGSKSSSKGAVPILARTFKSGMDDDGWISAVCRERIRRYSPTRRRFEGEEKDAKALNAETRHLQRYYNPGGTPDTGGGNNGLSDKQQKVVSLARSYLGKLRYVWGGKNISSGGVDCSGFTYAIFMNSIGLNISHGTYNQIQKGTTVSSDSARAADLVFFHSTFSGRGGGPTHVGIVEDSNGNFIHIGDNRGVRRSNFKTESYWRSKLLRIKRVI
jgi:cell wall-associated NlpC family hydrolase